jgi:flagellin-like hook-associated protein FlgL
MRSNLLNLQGTSRLLDRTQVRLSTGKKVNTALDDPVNFFAAQGLTNRASDLAALKDGMSEAIQTVKAADNGITGITKLIESAKGLAQAARSSDTAGRSTLAAQFDDLLTQIDQMAADASYKGTNLVDGDDLLVNFNESGTSSLTIAGFSGDSAGLSISAAAANWTADSDITAAVDDLTAALTTLRTKSSEMSSNLNIVSTRQEFTSNMIGTLQTGADNLTLADMNEEGANMLMLQTRQSLGVTALSLSSQAAQSVLSLFG